MHEKAGEIFPEYYVLRVNEFNTATVTPIDQWIAYLKTGDIPENATAPGLPEARQKLRFDQMSREEKISYERHFDNLRIQWDVLNTAHIEGRDEGLKEGFQKGQEEGKVERSKEIARTAKAQGLSLQIIIQLTGLSEEEVNTL